VCLPCSQAACDHHSSHHAVGRVTAARATAAGLGCCGACGGAPAAAAAGGPAGPAHHHPLLLLWGCLVLPPLPQLLLLCPAALACGAAWASGTSHVPPCPPCCHACAAGHCRQPAGGAERQCHTAGEGTMSVRHPCEVSSIAINTAQLQSHVPATRRPSRYVMGPSNQDLGIHSPPTCSGVLTNTSASTAAKGLLRTGPGALPGAAACAGSSSGGGCGRWLLSAAAAAAGLLPSSCSAAAACAAAAGRSSVAMLFCTLAKKSEKKL
jgi:hypothetical protein